MHLQLVSAQPSPLAALTRAAVAPRLCAIHPQPSRDPTQPATRRRTPASHHVRRVLLSSRTVFRAMRTLAHTCAVVFFAVLITIPLPPAPALAASVPVTEVGLPAIVRMPEANFEQAQTVVPSARRRQKTSFVTSAVNLVGPAVVRIDTERIVDKIQFQSPSGGDGGCVRVRALVVFGYVPNKSRTRQSAGAAHTHEFDAVYVRLAGTSRCPSRAASPGRALVSSSARTARRASFSPMLTCVHACP